MGSERGGENREREKNIQHNIEIKKTLRDENEGRRGNIFPRHKDGQDGAERRKKMNVNSREKQYNTLWDAEIKRVCLASTTNFRGMQNHS